MQKVSCVIVCYNNANYINRAIESVIKQTRIPDEVIVADDGSSDASREIISSLALKYPVIKPIFRETNLGVAANRDLAIRSASHPFVTTLDGDDWFYPEKIQIEMDLVNLGADVAYSDYTYINENDICIERVCLKTFSELDSRHRLEWIAMRNGYIPRDIMFRKEIYESIGGLDHDLKTHEDWDLKLRLSNTDAVWKYNPGMGTAYRRAGQGLSATGRLRRCRSQLKILGRNYSMLKTEIGLTALFRVYMQTLVRMARIISVG